jgi:hypothetical protein
MKGLNTDVVAANKILEVAARLGWDVNVRGSILTISKEFTPGDNDALVTCDMEYYGILSYLKTTYAGSTWGTDCGGIGAMSALKYGRFTMNKSGGNKRVLSALKKIL